MDKRTQQLQQWASQMLDIKEHSPLRPLENDASFRRYFRIQHHNSSYIVMDAPPEKETCLPFVRVTSRFRQMGLQTPEVLFSDIEKGFLLITDFGDDLYVKILNERNVDSLYKNAIQKLLILQSCKMDLAKFDRKAMLEELENFTKWFLQDFLKFSLNTQTQNLLNDAYALLLHHACRQPQCCIHRDYHSRNLIALTNNEVGILDFQDAMLGPITYDLVSLIRDCYINWPKDKVIEWAKYYFSYINLKETEFSFKEFLYLFDMMGIQRHLKAIFIFARKYLRDKDSNYLQDIPRAINYIYEVSANYSELESFHKFLIREIVPAYKHQIEQI